MPAESVTPAEFDHLLSAYRVSLETDLNADLALAAMVFDSDEYEALRPFTNVQMFQPGDIIIRENDFGDSIYIIRSGNAVVVKGDLQSPVILSFRGAGDMVGEMAVLENQPRSATVVALGPMELWSLGLQELYLLMGKDPGLSIKLMGLMSSRMRQLYEQRDLQAVNGKQREEKLRSLREQAIRDPLTGLFNRRYMEETLTREIARARREGTEIGILMIDIDDFKRVNDTHGHPAGDAVLRGLSRLLMKCIRTQDIACRYGGEEFVVIMPGAALPVAYERAEAIRQTFQSLCISYGEKELGATLSIGAAGYPCHGASGEVVLLHADQALYLAKQGGRNRVVIFDFLLQQRPERREEVG